MAFDKTKVSGLSADKKAALDAALKEIDLSIDEIETTHTKAETEAAARVKAEADLKTVQENWKIAYDEYGDVINDLDATTKEKQAAEAKLAQAENKRLEAEKKLAEQLNKSPELDTSKFLSVEEFEKRRRQDAQGQAAYFGDTLDAVAEIERVTKQRVSPKDLIQKASAAKQTPLEYAETTYKLSEKRAETAAAERQKELDAAEQRGREKVIAEMANPSTRTLEDSRDPFYVPKEGKAVDPWNTEEADPLEMKLRASSPEAFDAAFTKMVGVQNEK